MHRVELVADGDVVSYMFRRRALGSAYSQLIGHSDVGITYLAVSESRQGVVYGNWSASKIAALDSFLSRFFVLESNAEIANICGGLLGRCKQIGRSLSWPDAWAAATALWLDVPLVTHDRDLEMVPGLQVLTIHAGWQVREEGVAGLRGAPLSLGERGGGFGLHQDSVPVAPQRPAGVTILPSQNQAKEQCEVR